MNFKRKVTFYLNDENAKLDDLFVAVWGTIEGNDCVVSDERGSWVQRCQCGNEDCADHEVQQ